ncbi:MAG TPA: hypothetical protein VHE30_25965 [Polyangiaceae bacterium]|nr:hypothetical protein [Polyangiaceae bacterium]
MANLTETATWVTPVTGIDNGDPLDSTELTNPETQLTKRTNYLREHTQSARDVSDKRMPILNGVPDSSSPTTWNVSQGVWFQADTSQCFLFIDLDLPPGVTLTSVVAHVQGSSGAGSHAALPANMPILALVSLDPSDELVGTPPAVVASQADVSTPVANYNAAHTIVVSLSHVVDGAKRYMARIQSEYGSNSEADKLVVKGVSVSWTAPASV